MVACLVQQFVSVGLGFGLSIMYVELIAVFDAKRSDAALIQGLYLGLAVGTGTFSLDLISSDLSNIYVSHMHAWWFS